MYYQECRKRSPDDYISLRNVRNVTVVSQKQKAFETQQSMAAEATSKTKHPELKALEKQLQLSILKEKEPQTDSCLAFEVVGLFFLYTHLFMAVYYKIYTS